jgi:hypothetical protein
MVRISAKNLLPLSFLRIASFFAFVAACALVFEGALVTGHQLGLDRDAGYHGAYVHVHLAETAGHESDAGNDLTSELAGLAGQDGSSSCCGCALTAAVMLPSVNTQAEPLVLRVRIARMRGDHSPGFEPDSLRKPPRPREFA